MLLVIDMGNTNIELGGFEGDEITFRERISTDLEKTERDLLAPLRIRLNETIATLARSKHLAVVLNTDSNACPFIEPMQSIDLNDVVIRALGN